MVIIQKCIIWFKKLGNTIMSNNVHVWIQPCTFNIDMKTTKFGSKVMIFEEAFNFI
jgi:hypothetical protein